MSIAEELARYFSRDEARKQRVLADCRRLGLAMDAAPEASSRETAARVIKELGLPKIGGDADPIEMLDFYLAGRQHGQQLGAGSKAWALDGAAPGSAGDKIKRYLTSKE